MGDLGGLSPATETKWAKLIAWFQEQGRVVVAYSGGTDSALVLKVAHDALGQDAIAITAASESLPASELAEAGAIAAEIGAIHVIVRSRETEDPRYIENTPIRCYFCKSDVYERIAWYANEHGYACVVDGTNLDDLSDFRPGTRAGQERGVRSPLQEVGFTKSEIRELSRHLALATWDKPSAACLASRIPHGTAVTPILLGKVERSEAVLRRMGLGQLRVRHHDAIARIEVDPEQFDIVIRNRETIVRELKEIGYTFVALDLTGFRSGSLSAGFHSAADRASGTGTRAEGIDAAHGG
jgi:uncharacterized protein